MRDNRREAKRKSGYYWVKDKYLGWIISEYNHREKTWYICGGEWPEDPNDFEEIDERPILREEK